MPRRLLPALLFILAAPSALAQTALVGRVVDAESDLPLPTATASVLRVSGADSTFVTGAAANIDGEFRVPGVEPGAYTVVVSFVGYEDWARAVEVGAAEVDLGTVRLGAAAEALSEVRVTAERTQVQTRIDRTVYDTADDPVEAAAIACPNLTAEDAIAMGTVAVEAVQESTKQIADAAVLTGDHQLFV